jgi:hypothetical protein
MGAEAGPGQPIGQQKLMRPLVHRAVESHNHAMVGHAREFAHADLADPSALGDRLHADGIRHGS